jgi:glycerophosphoryl diester phosphodiesterase
MSVENTKIIDFISTDSNANVVLTISDHLEWDVENEHLLLLQNKINAYLEFIENGDLFEKYPDAKGRKIVVNLVTKHSLNKIALDFIGRVKDFLADHGYGFVLDVSNVSK